MSDKLTITEQEILLKIARQSLEASVSGEPLPEIDLTQYPPSLQKDGASFVTLRIQGNLRGCIGTLEACQPLVKDVQEHAAAAALQDFRFPQVQPSELPHIAIEVSVLSQSVPLHYDQPDGLISRLKPNVDGVVLRDGFRKATFLPQVWEKIPDPEHFLSQLCLKMGASKDLWRKKHLEIATYQVQEFHE